MRNPVLQHVAIRPLTLADQGTLLAMEQRIFHDPWGPWEFTRFLRPSTRGRTGQSYSVGLFPHEPTAPPSTPPATGEDSQVADLPSEAMAGYVLIHCLDDWSHIGNIGVLPEFRGKQYGKVLLATAMSHAISHGLEAVGLEVRVSNAVAIALYEQFGFKSERRRREYYEDGEDALWMVARLDRGGSRRTVEARLAEFAPVPCPPVPGPFVKLPWSPTWEPAP